ncbi:hypothetical protein [Stappia sp. ES.058]|uniref:hypothetical protein n=1 Tax=Stappia sp. ES.058 TaxID=1881061 RepID=UPI0008797F91|nr:hypothetical protein [Stappia sp. ES.058]SDU48381.1 hypothetical protein SAMN05428979_4266 [Stappia sp. ES.058]
MAGAGGQAVAQDSQRLWGAWGELGAQAGPETNAFLEGFMPIGQDADSIVFLDMRLDYGVNSRGSTSIGLGVREIVGPDLILGANAFVDAVRTENGNTFAGATLGLEAFTSIFDLRVNAHIPIGGGTTLSPIVTGDGVSIVANQLVENRSRTDRKEGLLYGLTGEIGAMFDSPFADNQRLRAYAGGYIYDRSGYDTEAGGRLGLEYQINDVLSLAGSRFTLGAELVYDKDDEFDAIASARLRIPLFAGAQSTDANGESRLSAIQQRMNEGVRRDKGIRVGTQSSTTAVNGVRVINPATGVAYGGVYYADQAGGGTGDFADPTALATAVANAGVGGIVVALGGGGPITTAGITLQSGQTLIGGGESILVQLADGSTTNFLLSGTNGTIDGDPGVTTVTLADGVTIRDLTIQGGTTVIGGNAVSNFTLTDLSIQNATDGIRVTGAVNASVSDISFSGITGTSLFLNNQSATISNITINGGTNGLSIANNTGTTTLSNINVSNVSGDALTFTNNTGIINVTGFTATNTGDDAIAVTGGGTFGFSGTTTLNGLGAGATSDGIDLSNTNNATLTFGDVDVTGLGGGTGLNMAGADATLTMQSLDITGTGVAGSAGVDLSGTQNGRTIAVTNGGTITNVDVGLVLGTNGNALAAPDAVFTWGGGDIGGLTYALDGVGVNAANGSYAFGTTGFTGAFNFTTSGAPNYFVAATATGSGDGSSTTNRASIATAIADAAGLGTVNFILINDGSAIDTSGLTFALADNQTIDTFGGGRTFTTAGLIIAANITGTNLPAGTTAITDPTGNGAATLTNSSGAVSTIAVANGNTIRNITLGSTLGTALSGSGVAGLTIEGVTIGTGTDTPVNGIELTNTTGAVTLTNVDITNTTGTGLSLNGASGTVTGNNVDITGANALSVTGGDAAVSFNASSSITNTSGTAVSITNRIGGSFTHFGSIASNGGSASGISITGATAASDVTFGGQVSLGQTTALGGGAGVSFDNNGTTSTLAFDGGLRITTSGQTGLDGTGGGTLRVSNFASETITTTGAMALSLTGLNVQATFDSIDTNNSNMGSVALRDLDGSLAVNGGTLATVASGSAFNSVELIQNDGAATRAFELAVDGLTITHDASSGNVGIVEQGILVETDGDDSAVVSVSNSTFATEDAAVQVLAANRLATVTNFANNTLLGSATSFDPTFFNNGVFFEGVTFDADLGTAGIQTVNGGTFASGTPGLANRNGLSFSAENSGSISFSDYTVNTVNTGLSASGDNGGLTLNIAGGSIDAGRVQLESTTGELDGSISLSSMTLDNENAGLGGFRASNYAGSFTVTGATNITYGEQAQDFGGSGYFRDSGIFGLSVVTSSGNFTFGDITIGTESGSALAGRAYTTGGSAVGINLAGNSGTFTSTGTVTITDTVEDAIRIADTSGAIAFNQVAIVNPRAALYPFTGPVVGTAREAHSAGVDISGTIDGTISFNDLDIALNSEETTGIELNGATLNAAVTANDFDVTGNGSANTIGVDLRGTTGGSTVRLGDAAADGEDAAIAGVQTGVFVNAASNAAFIFGDGEGATDQGSTISATTAIDATNAPVAGTYNFQDVEFAGSPGAGFGIGTIYFVDSDGATGGGDGSGSSATNPMTLAAAEAAAGAGDIIVLIDNGSAITAAGTNADDTLNLAASQQLLSFGDGAGGSQSVQVSLTVPPTIQLFAAGLTIADPTGGGAATLTTSAGNDVVTLGGDGIRISGIDFEGNGTAARGINDGGAGATGSVIERSNVSNFATVGIEITPSTNTTINDVDFSGNAGDILLNAAGSTLTNITSTGATGTAITLTNTTGTTTLSDISITGAANGISFTDASGTVTATNVDIAGGNTLAIDGGDAVFTFDADSSITTTSGSAVSINNRTGGSFTHAGTVVADGPGTGGISSSGATGAHSISFTGTVDLGLTTALGFSGVAIDNNGQNVDINFADIDVVTDGGFGMLVQIGGTLSVGTGSLAVDNAQTISFGSIGFGAGGVNFTSITGTNVGPVGIGLNTITGGDFTVTGTTTVSGSAGSAFSLTNVSSDMSFGTVNISVTSDEGLLLIGNAGTLTTGDMTIAMGTGGNGIRATGTNGDMTFGNVDITGLGAGTGLNLSGGTFDGQATFATLDITGTSQTGSTGIDLTSYDNSKDVVTTGSGTIQGVQTGIDLTNANIANGVRFQYGDGDGTNPGTESTIDTTGFAVVTTGMGSTGEYDLEDVAFGTVLGTTNTSNLAGPSYYVVGSNGSTGAGNGTFVTPGTITGAEASGADAIILVDNNDDDTRDVINVAAQDDGTFTLADDQVLVSMVNGETVDLATLGLSGSGAPASLKLTGIASSTQVTATGGTLDDVRAILTSDSANGTVTLSGSSTIQNTTIRNTGSGDGISASYAASATARIRSSQIDVSSSARSIDIATTGGASNVEFSDLDLDGSISFLGSGGGSLSVTSTGINRVDDTDAEAVFLQDADASLSGLIIGSSNTGTGNDVAGAGIHIVNSNGVSNTVTLTDITMGSGGSGDTSDVAGAGIFIAGIGPGDLTVNMTGTNVIRSTGQALDVDDLGPTSANKLQLSISNTTFESAATGASTVSIIGKNISTEQNSVQVRAFAGNTVIGNGTGGGIFFEKVDFDSDGAGATVSAGTLNVGQGTGARVEGDGVGFADTTGAIDFATLNIYNSNGTGLLVDTKTNGLNTDFTMTGGGSGTVDTTNGSALFLDPLTMNLSFSSVSSTSANGANGFGSGVFIDAGDAVGGAGNSALTIGTLNITGSSDSGVQIVNSSGDFSFGTTTINNAGSAGGGVEVVATASDTTSLAFTGGLDIDTSAGTGFDANATGGGALTLNVASSGTQEINTATGQILRMNDVTIGGTGVSFDTLAASSTVSGDAVRLFDVDGGAFNGGAVSVANTSTAGNGIVISGFSTSTFNFTSATIDGAAGAGILLSGANGAVTFDTVDIDGTGGDGVEIANAHSAVTISGGSIGATNDPAGIAVDINGGSANVTIAATVTKTTANDLIEISGRSAGTVTFSGNLSATGAAGGIQVTANNNGTINFSGGTKTLSTGTNTAVSLTNNNGTAINFIGGGLDIDTTSGAGFLASSSGTVTVQGTGNPNSVTTTTGRAVQIEGTTLGADGVTFQSVSTNGASNAINLRNTGSTGFFSITGTGSTDGSGGLIQNITGANMADETPTASGQGAAIYLENVSDVRIANLQVQNTTNFGLRGFGVDGMTMNNVDFTGAHGDDKGPDEGVFYVNNLTGTVGIAGGTYLGGIEDSINIDNDGTSGTLTLTMTGATVTTGDGANAAIGDNGITIVAEGGSVNGSINNNTFTAAVGAHIQLVSAGTADFGLTIDTNTFTKHSGIAGNGGIGVRADTQSSGDFNITISNNNLATLGSLNNAIDVGSVNGGGVFSGTVDMTISDNTIGSIGSVGSGTAFTAIDVDAAGGGSSIYRITNNKIYDHDRNGIGVTAGVGVGSSHQLSVLIQNNIITDNLSSGAFERGIQVDSGAQSGATPTVCATISGNEVTANGNYVDGIRVRARNNGNLQINNGGGGAATEVAIENHLTANNTVGNTIDAVISTSGSVTFVSSCPN